MASMSVSKGLAWCVVETSDSRGGAFSADGMSEDRVSWEGLSFKACVSTVSPRASAFSLATVEVMIDGEGRDQVLNVDSRNRKPKTISIDKVSDATRQSDGYWTI